MPVQTRARARVPELAVPAQATRVLRLRMRPPAPALRPRQAARHRQWLRWNVVSVYTCMLLSTVVGHSMLIRVYGETCGISLRNLMRLVTVGSPWCSGLHWMCQVTGELAGRVWYHIIGVCMYAALAALRSVDPAMAS